MASLCEEESQLLADPKYRSYVAIIEKALKGFESTSEWADLISTLAKLNKVLLSHTKYPIVPRRIIISKRLAQCMHPALPSGVHLKALETYDIIFRSMGTNRLSQELFIYSAGLFPVYVFAAMNVRSALLTIYESHFVPLGPRLRPGLNGFLSGILPGLEEGSDHLERTSLLLVKVAEGVGQAYFFGSLWECIAGSSGIRLPAITHITNCFNRRNSTEDQLYILGTNVDVMVSGLCSSLRDGMVLVQRAALDLTLTALPLHNSRLLLRHDIVRLVTAAINTLLRRDTSLNRRLYSWLLGSEVNTSLLPSSHPVVKKLNSSASTDETDTSYFSAFSRQLLIEGLIGCFKECEGKDSPDLRPYKLMVALLDKQEVGPLIVDHVLLDILRCLYFSCESVNALAPSGESSKDKRVLSDNSQSVKGAFELNRSAGLVFSAMEPAYPWLRMLHLLSEACSHIVRTDLGLRRSSMVEEDGGGKVREIGSGGPHFTEVCTLMSLMLNTLPLDTQQQTKSAKITEVLSVVTGLITDHVDILSARELLVGVELCHGILQKLIPSVTLPIQESSQGNISRAESRTSIATHISCQSNGYNHVGPLSNFTPQNIGTPMIEESSPEGYSSSSSSIDDMCEGIIQIGIEASEDGKEFRDIQSNKHLPESLDSRPVPEKSDVTYEDKPPDSMSQIISELSEGEKPSASLSLYLYVTEFEKFVKEFVQKRLLMEEEFSLQDFQDALFRIPSENDFGELKSLLEECLLCTNGDKVNNPINGELSNKARSSSFNHLHLFQMVKLKENALLDLKSFEVLCVMLIDLSSIPTTSGQPYNFHLTVSSLCSSRQSSSSLTVDGSSHLLSEQNSSKFGCLPSWLSAVIACACSAHIAVQHCALGTLLELLTLAQSELSVWREGGGAMAPSPPSLCEEGEAEGVITINIIPRIHPTHFHLLIHHTNLYQQISQALWSQLDNSECLSQVQSVDLLLKLHAITSARVNASGASSGFKTGGSSSNEPSLVERELLSQLNTPIKRVDRDYKQQSHDSCSSAEWSHGGLLPQYNIAALKKWLTLWQLSKSRSSHSSPFGLDRCLFLMLERVREGSSAERSLAQRWLCHSLASGDSARIIDPVLCLLLHPHTRRVSVQHVSVRQIKLSGDDGMMVLGSRAVPTDSQSSDTASEGASESLIYAISSVGGEVMYHVSKEPLRDKGKDSNVSKKLLASAAKHLLALTSLSKDSKKIVTENIELPDYEVPYMGEKGASGQQHMSVLVNPFSRHPWLEMEDVAKICNAQSSNTVTNDAEASKSSGRKSSSESGVDTDSESTSRMEDCPVDIQKTPSGEDLPDMTNEETATDIANGVLEEILTRVIQRCAPSPPLSDPESSSSSSDTPRKTPDTTGSNLRPPDMTLHPLHSHMLLYTQLVDSGRCLYGLRLLKNVIESQPKLSLLSLASTGISHLQPSSLLLMLLARHKRCVFGQGFDGGNESEMIGQYRSTMYLQVVITICLYYLRSYYPRLPHLRLKDEHLNDNKEVQVMAIEVLVLVFTNLSSLVRDSPRGLAPFVLDLLNKCKVQKCVLHCLLATVHAMRLPGNTFSNRKSHATEAKTFTQELLDYNNRTVDGHCLAGQETYLSNAMNLTLALIKLEDALAATKIDSLPREDTGSTSKSNSSSTHYRVGLSIPAQPMFIRVVSSALGQKHTRHFHSAWLHLFTSALPHMGSALTSNCLKLCSLLCVLIEELPKYYCDDETSRLKPIPPDYAIALLSSLTTVVHFCLLDPTQSPLNVSPSVNSYANPNINSGSNAPSTNSSSNSGTQSTSSNLSGHILFNLLHVFSPSGEVMEATLDTSGQDPLTCARRTILSHLPRIVAAVTSLWGVTYPSELARHKKKSNGFSIPNYSNQCLAGSSSSIVQQIIAFLSPICHHHTPHFIAAISVVWQSLAEENNCAKSFPINNLNAEATLIRSSSFSAGKKNSLSKSNQPLKSAINCGSLQDVTKAVNSATAVSKGQPMRRGSIPDRVTSEPSETVVRKESSNDAILSMEENREMLVKMVGAIRVLPLHLLLDTVKLVLRQPPTVEGFVQNVSVEVSVLEVVSSYIRTSSSEQLGACWAPLLTLLKEAVLALQPNALLLLLPILNDFVQRAPPLKDKKEIKELQDVSGRLIENISNIAGSCLEATTWLRRNLTVKSGVDLQVPNNSWIISVSALETLASELAALLDVLYSSEEKDKVLPLLAHLMTHVTPYLRNHSSSNQTAFLLCSRLVASLSEYQYTLKAWKKDVLELFLDSAAFKMTPEALVYWRTTIDNLYTHDKTMFKELLGRVSMSQGGTLHLFSSKESEYENRAMLFKRLSFAVYCSESDQYSKFFPDIQERVTEISRLSEVVPVLVSAVLNVVGVVVVRMSPRTIVSLWPAIITEMVQVFLVMEQQLTQDTAMFSDAKKNSSDHLKRVSALDSRWVVSSSNSTGLRSLSHPSWLSLYLTACKLLDLLLALPAHALPQFQMYRWAFVGSGTDHRNIPNGNEGGDAATVAATRKADSTTSSGIVMKSCDFVPHVVRIAKLMEEQSSKRKVSKARCGDVRPVRLNDSPHQLLLSTVSTIDTLMDLQPFFHRLSSQPLSLTTQGSDHQLKQLDTALLNTFLEPLV